jgi:hypothetical protein
MIFPMLSLILLTENVSASFSAKLTSIRCSHLPKVSSDVNFLGKTSLFALPIVAAIQQRASVDFGHGSRFSASCKAIALEQFCLTNYRRNRSTDWHFRRLQWWLKASASAPHELLTALAVQGERQFRFAPDGAQTSFVPLHIKKSSASICALKCTPLPA